MTYAQSGMAAVAVQVVLAEPDGVYAEVAATLSEGLTGHPELGRWDVGTWEQLRKDAARRDPPQLVVTVGLGALRSVLADPGGRAPVLALLLPRGGYEKTLREAGPARPVAAIVLDQPAGRQLALVRLALPMMRQVGLLHGAETRPLATVFQAAARARGLTLRTAETTVQGLSGALQKILAESDALIAVPDGEIINNQTIASILTAGYRQRVPLLGYSPSLVRAGALLGLYSTPRQVAEQGIERVRDILAGERVQGVQPPRRFTVAVNASVARSLGLVLDEQVLERELRLDEGLR